MVNWLLNYLNTSDILKRKCLKKFKDSFLALCNSSVGKESACSAADSGLIPRLGRSPGGKGYPFQYSGLENSVDYVPWGLKELESIE